MAVLTLGLWLPQPRCWDPGLAGLRVAAAHGPVLVALLALYSDSAAWVCADEENVIGTFSLLVL